MLFCGQIKPPTAHKSLENGTLRKFSRALGLLTRFTQYWNREEMRTKSHFGLKNMSSKTILGDIKLAQYWCLLFFLLLFQVTLTGVETTRIAELYISWLWRRCMYFKAATFSCNNILRNLLHKIQFWSGTCQTNIYQSTFNITNKQISIALHYRSISSWLHVAVIVSTR